MKIVVFDRQGRNGARVQALTRWYGRSDRGCCVHDVRTDDPKKGNLLAVAEHREKCLTSQSARERLRYPRTWQSFSARIRFQRARGRCECAGECGLGHPGGHGESARCAEMQDEPAQSFAGRVRLTVAHLNARGGPCSCEPLCAEADHVKAMCQRCHLRYDVPRHRSSTRRVRAERSGQMELALG